ncbi:hypothetical protein JQC91_04120 [Jannaschia sp. Os4]|uniref:hypothetical protein n=1 Tax=Jannaschia sp. Os4 TaxID=2807617 RepID=UPI00193A69BE|nr:hypothetical protein [Jannaschia sp. Os4]MBM2575481.1 hypothetical protein [Jannaschia sp. Os4]
MLLRTLLAALLLAPPLHAAPEQIAEGRATAAAYADLRDARRDGWRKFGGPAALMGQHYYNGANPDYVAGEPLDPARLSNLLYAEIGGRQTLVGVAYNYRIGDGDLLPEGFRGGADVWHVHDVAKFAAAVTTDRPLLRWAADRFLTPEFTAADGTRRDRLAMVHLWTIPNPDGPFASHNRALAYLQLGLPGDWADGASKEAALGLSLARPEGCAEMIDTDAWIANLPRATTRRLHSACRQVADHVRARLGSKAQANAAGEGAWAAFDRVRDESLTPVQKLRIASIVEDGPGLLCR